MKKRCLLILVFLSTALLLFACTPAQNNYGNEEENEEPNNEAVVTTIDYSDLGDVFAFANQAGDKLLTFSQIEDESALASLDVAIGTNGQYLNIAYLQKQNSNANDNFNANAYNFDNYEGYLFEVTGTSASADETYLLTTKASVPADALLVSSLSGPVVLTHEHEVEIGNEKGRTATDGWVLASYADNSQLLLVVFEPQGDEYLFCIVLKTAEGQYKFKEYPATSDDGQSVWRVDDGGNVDPTLFNIILSAYTNNGLVTLISWAGAEGEVDLFLMESGSVLAEQSETASRYWGAY